jgi:ribonuclease VapC
VICVDSSALMAIVLNEPDALRCRDALKAHEVAVISAGTLAEAMIAATRRSVGEQMAALIDAAELQVIEVTRESAFAASRAYRRYGKSWHAAGLNYGDCFAYELAERMGCPLLFIGDDFPLTDLESVL